MNIAFSSQMLQNNESLQGMVNKLKLENEELRIASERYKSLQTHSSHQQALLHQLKNRLEEHE